MFGEAWSPMSVPDLAPDDDDDESRLSSSGTPSSNRIMPIIISLA